MRATMRARPFVTMATRCTRRLSYPLLSGLGWPKPRPRHPLLLASRPFQEQHFSSAARLFRPFTDAEFEEISKLLRKGCQPWEVARCLGRSVDSVHRLLKNDPNIGLLRQSVKAGPWSELEDELVRSKSTAGSNLNIKASARSMGRTETSIKARLRVLKQKLESHKPAVICSLPQGKLSPHEIHQLRERLGNILGELCNAPMAPSWQEVIFKRFTEEWAEQILRLIPPPLGHILASHWPPTMTNLDWFLKWQETNDMGVYARILKGRIVSPFQPDYYMYVGSATSPHGGLSKRRHQHGIRVRNGGARSGFTRRVCDLTTGKKDEKFVTLLRIPVDLTREDEVWEARRLAVVAEAVLTVWLGALMRDGACRSLQGRAALLESCPWDVGDIPYGGLCSHNPLELDINLSREEWLQGLGGSGQESKEKNVEGDTEKSGLGAGDDGLGGKEALRGEDDRVGEEGLRDEEGLKGKEDRGGDERGRVWQYIANVLKRLGWK